MNSGRTIFAQLMDLLPLAEFHRCVDRYRGDYKVQSFSCLDQFLCLAFAQLTYRESLRDIQTCLRAHQSQLYHMGFRGGISRNNLANANLQRDWRIYADFARVLIAQARALYQHEPFGVELEQTVYAFDSTTVDLCLSLFPWAQFRRHKSAVKLHTLLDLRGSIPTAVYVTSGRVNDVRLLDQLVLEAGAFYLLGRKGSGTLSRAPWVPHRVFQPELRHRLAYPSLRPIRLASFYGISDLFNFFLGLRAVKPLQIMARLWHGPRAEKPLLAFVPVQAGVNAGPWPFLRPFDQARSLGVSFHVANQPQEMAVLFDGERLISALVNMAVSDGPGFGVITLRVGQGDPLQEFRQVAVGARIKHHMPMVRHQAVSQYAHRHEFQALPHQGQKILIMRFLLEKTQNENSPGSGRGKPYRQHPPA